MNSKGEIVERYCKAEPTTFIQYVGVVDGNPPEYNDADGDWLCSYVQAELIERESVRLLIDPSTAKHDVVRVLNKMRRWIIRNWDAWKDEPGLMPSNHERCRPDKCERCASCGKASSPTAGKGIPF